MINKSIKISIKEIRDGIYSIKANNVEFNLLRTGDGENEYLEVFPSDFPFRAIKLMTEDVSTDLLETIIVRELLGHTSKIIDI